MYGSSLTVRHTVLSEPAEVWWAGFRSDTYQLQQAGWEIAAEQDVMYDRIRLLLRHRDMKLYALTNECEYHFRDMYQQPGRRLTFKVVAASPNFQVQCVPSRVDFSNFQQIDAKPQWAEIEIKSIEDFKIFATPLARTEEIIVEPQTVSAMLEKIREMQAPEQARLRAKQRLEASREGLRGDAVPRQRFHAQIISIEDHRLAA